MHIGGDIVGLNTPDIVGFGSITAATFFGNGAGLTNTGAELSASGTNGDTQRVTLTHLTSGTMTAATTDAQLTFTSSTNTLACTTFSGALSGNATSSSTSANLSFGSANQVVFKNSSNNGATSSALTFNGTQLNCTNNIRANNITLGLTAGTTINTATGDLVLDSSNNKVHITANAEVDGSMTIDSGTDSSSKDTGALVLTAGGLGVEGKIHCGDDIIAFNTSDISLKDNITPIPNSLDKILSLSGNIFSWNSKSDYKGTDDTVSYTHLTLPTILLV